MLMNKYLCCSYSTPKFVMTFSSGSDEGVPSVIIKKDGFYDANKVSVISDSEKKVQDILLGLAPGILTQGESILLDEIPEEITNLLFSSDVKFKTKVEAIKPFIKQPNRLALVRTAPTLEQKPVRYPQLHFKVIELFYCLNSLIAVIPSSDSLVRQLIESFSSMNLEELTEKDVKDLLDALTKLRGFDAAISAVISAASKIFFTVDGLAFDEFSVSLSVAEWEIITEAMNRIRLDFANEIKEKASVQYHLNTSKQKKLLDKKDLEKRIHAARGPLLQIMKLNKDDLHPSDQLSLLKTIDLKSSTKKIAFERKESLALAKAKILEYYRSDSSIDILKFVKETRVLS